MMGAFTGTLWNPPYFLVKKHGILGLDVFLNQPIES
jgi:hypothetical protein